MTSPHLDKNITCKIPQLAITYLEIHKLKPDAKNPRIHSKRQIQQIANSVHAFGLNVPFLVDQNLKLIAGHGRLAACKLLGIMRVPTISLDHLTEDQARAFMIADNRLTENAEWDHRLLGEELKALSEVQLDFNLEDTGFEMGEIDTFIEGLPSSTAAELADMLPTETSTVTVTKLGDVWLLGSNRLIFGDGIVGETYQQVLDDRLAAAVFSDRLITIPLMVL